MQLNMIQSASLGLVVVAIISLGPLSPKASGGGVANDDDCIRADSSTIGAFAPGIAGVEFSEDFETGYQYPQPCVPPPGWTCVPVGMQTIDHPDLCFGFYSAQDASANVSTNLTLAFPIQTGALYTDIIISDNTSPWQWNALSTAPGNTSNYFNVRVKFESSGAITALQIDSVVEPDCAPGTTTSWHVTSGTWSPGVKMRMGIDVQPGGGPGSLRLYKDDRVIFIGTDISQACAPGNPVGMSRLQNVNLNDSDTSTMVIDNISNSAIVDACTCELPACAADVHPTGGDGSVNIGDLLAVIAGWAQTQTPPSTGPRPPGDCAPGLHGDCVVNITDLLTVVNGWGLCP